MGKILIEKSGIFTEISGGSQETPQQLLAKILTVDGKGSGLDADSLGGINYSQYALIKDYLTKSEINNKISQLTPNTEFQKVKDSTQEIKNDVSKLKFSSIKEWNNTDTFKKGSLILYKGYLFRATEDSTNVEPTLDSKTAPYYSKEEVDNLLNKKISYNPNLLMNSNFSIMERLDKPFEWVNRTNDTYITDRWFMASNNDNTTYQSIIAKLPKNIKFNSDYNMALAKTGGDGEITIHQCLEGLRNIKKGETFTVSGYIWINEYATVNELNCQVFLQPSVNKFTKTLTPSSSEIFKITKNQLNKFETQITVNQDITLLLSSSDYSSEKSSWIFKISVFGLPVNASICFREIKLERGNVATDWTPYGGSIENDRQACLRYFERIKKRHHFNTYISTNNSEYLVDIDFKVQKRIDDYRVDFTVNEAIGLKKGNVVDGIYTESSLGENKNKDGILFLTKIKNKHAYFDNVTIDADF